MQAPDTKGGMNSQECILKRQKTDVKRRETISLFRIK